MDIIYEVPNRFRITNIPCYALGPGSPVLSFMSEPFLLNYRHDGVAKAESCQLPNALFAAIVGCETPLLIHSIRPYLKDEYAMSDAMLAALLAAPKELAAFAQLNQESEEDYFAKRPFEKRQKDTRLRAAERSERSAAVY